MTASELNALTPQERAIWLDEMSPTATWTLGDDVFCALCDGVWKAEDVACAPDGFPACPVCLRGTPIEFGSLPWWREDLTDEEPDHGGYSWRVPRIEAEPGKPRKLPKPRG